MTMSAQSNAAKAAIAGAVLISAAPAFAGDAGAGEKVRIPNPRGPISNGVPGCCAAGAQLLRTAHCEIS
jgi:hypothetical protein